MPSPTTGTPRVSFKLPTEAEVAENYRRFNASRPRPAATRAPIPGATKPYNVEPLLDLGDTVYFQFRGRAYGIPPLGWRAGQRLHLLWVEALEIASPITKATAPAYYQLIAQLPRLLWANCRPTGWLRRRLWRLGLLRNPFRRATETELVELAAFFLSRRSRSSIGLRPARTTTRDRGTSSMSSANSPTGSRAGSTTPGTR